MFCVSCWADYPGDLIECPECGSPLVVERPPSPRYSDPAHPLNRWAVVFRTTDLTLLAVVKTVLQETGIPFVVQGEEGLRLFPMGPFGAGFYRTVNEAVIRVPPERVTTAELFLRGVEEEPGEEDEGEKD